MSKKIIAISLTAIILVAFCTVLLIQCTNAGTENPTVVESINTDPTVTASETKLINSNTNKSKTPDSLKEKIVEIFPDIAIGSLSATTEPGRVLKEKKYIVYENALTKSGKKYKMKVDYDTNEIVSYAPLFGVQQKNGQLNISLEDAEKIALALLNKMSGEKSEYYINNSVITSSYFENTTADVRLNRVMNSVPCLTNGINFGIDPMNGKVLYYSKNWLDLDNITFTSPKPDITVDEAKKIIETTVNKKYPGTIKSFNFGSGLDNSDIINLCWFDDSELLYYEKEMPIRLVWPLMFYVELNDNSENNRKNTLYHFTCVDAHSGEILTLSYEEISIKLKDQLRGK